MLKVHTRIYVGANLHISNHKLTPVYVSKCEYMETSLIRPKGGGYEQQARKDSEVAFAQKHTLKRSDIVLPMALPHRNSLPCKRTRLSLNLPDAPFVIKRKEN